MCSPVLLLKGHTDLTYSVAPRNIWYPDKHFSQSSQEGSYNSDLQRCSVRRLEVDVVSTPDGPADVDLLTVNDSLVVETPLCSVHQLTLVVPVKPLAREEVVLVPPAGACRGDIVQTLTVL